MLVRARRGRSWARPVTAQLLHDRRHVVRLHVRGGSGRRPRRPSPSRSRRGTRSSRSVDLAVLGRLAGAAAELVLERLEHALRADERARDVRADLDDVLADRLEVEHVVEGRDRLAVGGRQVERVGDLAERLGRQPAVLLLREAQRRDHGRRRAVRVLLAHLLDLVVERGRAHRSTSPITVSSEPTIAIMSAISASRHARRRRLERDERRRAELHAPRPRAAVGDDVAAELAARRLDR